MPWVPFTSADIKAHLLDTEVELYDDLANDPVGESKLPAIVAHVVARVRGACLANPNLPYLGPEGTIPDFCVYHAAVQARHALISLLPVPEGYSDPRRDEKKSADDFLTSMKEMQPRAFLAEQAVVPASAPSFGGKPLLDF